MTTIPRRQGNFYIVLRFLCFQLFAKLKLRPEANDEDLEATLKPFLLNSGKLRLIYNVVKQLDSVELTK
jgi:hypothetical protein